MILWLGTALASELPLAEEGPRLYLDVPAVRAGLHRVLPALAPCYAALGDAPVEHSLSLIWHPDGRLTDPALAPSDPVLSDCLAEVLAAHPAATHHDDPLRVGTILVWRQGRLVPHPEVALDPRPDTLLFVYLPDPAIAADLQAALQGAPAAE